MNTLEKTREKIKKVLIDNADWRDILKKEFPCGIDSYYKKEILWVLCDILKDTIKDSEEETESLTKAIEIVEDFINTDDESQEKETYTKCNAEVMAGDDVRWIDTVKGTAPWLIEAIVFKFNTAYYGRALDLTEKLLNDKNLYVRKNAVIALCAFTRYIYAETDSNSSTFAFDKDRVKKIAIGCLTDEVNQKTPRIIEILAQPFNFLRRENLEMAKLFLNYLIYKDGDANKKEFQPEYVLRDVTPLLMYYAEFRKNKDNSFDDTYFKTLLENLIKNSSGDVRSGIIWHIWKTIEDDSNALEKFKKYIPFLFEGRFYNEIVSQISFLIEKIFAINPDYSLNLLDNFLTYIKNREKKEDEDFIWLMYMENLLVDVARDRPDSFLKYLQELFEIWLSNRKHLFVGDVPTLFTSYMSNKDESVRNSLREGSIKVYESIKSKEPSLIDVGWK